ncbi:unnamed protein product [Leuciscus chuanchicus]
MFKPFVVSRGRDRCCQAVTRTRAAGAAGVQCTEEGTSRFTGISSPTSCGESRTTGSRKTLKDTKHATFYSSGRSRPQPLSGRSQAPSRWCCRADIALSRVMKPPFVNRLDN